MVYMNKNQIIDWLEKYNINNYIIKGDLSVDVNQNVSLFNLNLKEIPIKFNIVKGDFYCYDNNKLTSLKYCPKEIKGDFYCYDNNKLTSLKYCPKEIKGDFYCVNNKFKDFNNWPKTKYCFNILKKSLNEKQLLELIKKEPEWLEWFI